jgi:hypothetical protein
LYVESLTNILALHLLRSHAVFPQHTSTAPGTLDAPRLRRIVDYIDADLAHDLTPCAVTTPVRHLCAWS